LVDVDIISQLLDGVKRFLENLFGIFLWGGVDVERTWCIMVSMNFSVMLIEIGEICCTHRPIFKAHEEEPATGKAE